MTKPKKKTPLKSSWLGKVQAHTLEQTKSQCLDLLNQGVAYHEIAKQLSITPATLKKWVSAEKEKKETNPPRG